MADSGLATTVAEVPGSEGVATGTDGQEIATPEESWDSLIKGKYKDDYDRSVKEAINKRFKNQRDLQGQIDMIDPVIRAIAQKYGVNADENGNISVKDLQAKVMDDDSLYEEEAFQRGMSIKDLKELKNLERENQMLKMQNTRTAEMEEWNDIVRQAEDLKQIYPAMDLDEEMQNPHFGRLLATMQKSRFPNPVQTAYEAVHREEIMGTAMGYAVEQTRAKISNSIQSGMARPNENGTSQQSSAQIGAMDPSHLTKAQLDDLKRRAERGERITFV